MTAIFKSKRVEEKCRDQFKIRVKAWTRIIKTHSLSGEIRVNIRLTTRKMKFSVMQWYIVGKKPKI